jgi:hypothetical protein
MRIRKKITMMVLTLGLLGLLSTNVSAELGWYTCTIYMVGPSQSTYYINLSDTSSPPAFENQWFILVPEYAKQMLAVALAAKTSQMRVIAYIDPEQTYSYCYALYLFE